MTDDSLTRTLDLRENDLTEARTMFAELVSRDYDVKILLD